MNGRNQYHGGQEESCGGTGVIAKELDDTSGTMDGVCPKRKYKNKTVDNYVCFLLQLAAHKYSQLKEKFC